MPVIDINGYGSHPMLAGNIVALLSPFVFIPILTYTIGADNYDYESMRSIKCTTSTPSSSPRSPPSTPPLPETQDLQRASSLSRLVTAIMTLALLVLWPMPMYASSYVFSKKFFTGWVSVGILWLFFSAFCVGIYPLWEGRGSIYFTTKSIFSDIRNGFKGSRIVDEGMDTKGEAKEEVAVEKEEF
jgi:hypothetical protein